MHGDREFERMARETLDAQRQLIDPVWGGVYQYSTDGDWKHPHFEKIMQMQAENLRIYAQAYALWKEPSYLEAATKIREYLRNFLTSPDGAFYTSQDADLVQGEHSADYFALDDSDRRKRGIPRIDSSFTRAKMAGRSTRSRRCTASPATRVSRRRSTGGELDYRPAVPAGRRILPRGDG